MAIRKPAKTVHDFETEEKVDKRKEDKAFVEERQANGLYALKFTAGGEVPDELKGYYTSRTKAERAAINFMLRKNAASAS